MPMEAIDRIIDIVEDRLALSTILTIVLEVAETGVAPSDACIPPLHNSVDEEVCRKIIGKLARR